MGNNLVKVSFDIELARRITNKEIDGYIKTKNGYNVRIIAFDIKSTYNIIAVISSKDNNEEVTYSYTRDGKFTTNHSALDLELEIPEYLTFKDGDILHYDNATIIFKEYNKDSFKYYCSYHSNTLAFNSSCSGRYINETIRKATEKEIKEFIDILRNSSNKNAKIILKNFFNENIDDNENNSYKKVLDINDLQTLIILDFSTGEVHIFKVDKNIEIDEEYIDNKLNLNPNNCQWMIVDEELNIKLH